MSLNELKIVLMLLTLIFGWGGGMLPLALGRRRPGRVWIGAGNSFAAGLFLAIGLLHFLPESALHFREFGVDYPLGSLLAVVAFILLLLFEHVLSPEQAHRAAHAHSGQGLHGRSGSHGHGPGHDDSDHERTGQALGSTYVLALALSVHSVLAGLALGAETDARGATLTFLAIATHKGTAGLALGLSLLHSGTPRARATRFVAAFALMTPLGILAGMLAGAALRSDAHLLFDAIATALAAGTFLYIGAFDLLQDESLRPGRRWTKWIWAVAGVLLAALLSAWL